MKEQGNRFRPNFSDRLCQSEEARLNQFSRATSIIDYTVINPNAGIDLQLRFRKGELIARIDKGREHSKKKKPFIPEQEVGDLIEEHRDSIVGLMSREDRVGAEDNILEKVTRTRTLKVRRLQRVASFAAGLAISFSMLTACGPHGSINPEESNLPAVPTIDASAHTLHTDQSTLIANPAKLRTIVEETDQITKMIYEGGGTGEYAKPVDEGGLGEKNIDSINGWAVQAVMDFTRSTANPSGEFDAEADALTVAKLLADEDFQDQVKIAVDWFRDHNQAVLYHDSPESRATLFYTQFGEDQAPNDLVRPVDYSTIFGDVVYVHTASVGVENSDSSVLLSPIRLLPASVDASAPDRFICKDGITGVADAIVKAQQNKCLNETLTSRGTDLNNLTGDEGRLSDMFDRNPELRSRFPLNQLLEVYVKVDQSKEHPTGIATLKFMFVDHGQTDLIGPMKKISIYDEKGMVVLYDGNMYALLMKMCGNLILEVTPQKVPEAVTPTITPTRPIGKQEIPAPPPPELLVRTPTRTPTPTPPPPTSTPIPPTPMPVEQYQPPFVPPQQPLSPQIIPHIERGPMQVIKGLDFNGNGDCRDDVFVSSPEKAGFHFRFHWMVQTDKGRFLQEIAQDAWTDINGIAKGDYRFVLPPDADPQIREALRIFWVEEVEAKPGWLKEQGIRYGRVGLDVANPDLAPILPIFCDLRVAAVPTAIATSTSTPSPTPTTIIRGFTPGPTETGTATVTVTPGINLTATIGPSPTETGTPTPGPSPTPSETPTPSPTLAPGETRTVTPTATATFTPTPTATLVPGETPRPTETPTAIFTPTSSPTEVPTPERTATPTPAFTATFTATPSPFVSLTPTQTPEPVRTSTSTATLPPTFTEVPPSRTVTSTATLPPTIRPTATFQTLPTSTATIRPTATFSSL